MKSQMIAFFSNYIASVASCGTFSQVGIPTHAHALYLYTLNKSHEDNCSLNYSSTDYQWESWCNLAFSKQRTDLCYVPRGCTTIGVSVHLRALECTDSTDTHGRSRRFIRSPMNISEVDQLIYQFSIQCERIFRENCRRSRWCFARDCDA